MDYPKLIKAMRKCASCDVCCHEECEYANLPNCEDVLLSEAADAIEELLNAASSMHEWIFLNTADEAEAYRECHLTDEMNYALGYGGNVEMIIGDDSVQPSHE